jgi:tRNA (Thr-GGU) A37 N-methylase
MVKFAISMVMKYNEAMQGIKLVHHVNVFVHETHSQT